MHLSVNGLPLFVRDTGGSQPPVVFIHGFPFNSSMWDGQIDALAGRFRTIAYDVRGHGVSDPGDGIFTIDSHVDDLFGLLDLLQPGPVISVGLSMGGYILQRALEREPARFRAVILADTRNDSDSNDARLKRAENIKNVRARGSAAFADGFIPNVIAPASAGRADLTAKIREMITTIDPRHIAGTLLALASRPDTSQSLSRLGVPALFVVGAYDKTSPPEFMEKMHESVPGSSYAVIPDAGHLSNMENPGAFNTALLTFLDRLTP